MIPIRNIYHMLAYAFQALRWRAFKDVATEDFGNTADLCSAILAKGVGILVKRGVGREYLERSEELASPRGRFEVSETVKTLSMVRKRVVCSYDELSADSRPNRILKATMNALLRANIPAERKRDLRRLLVYFTEVRDEDVRRLDWNVQYNRGNDIYRMLLAVCYLAIKGLLQTDDDGRTHVADVLDEQRMSRLFEKFILEYYRKEWPGVHARAAQIPWAVDDGERDLLPVMQSDITLSYRKKVLIIDAKYYGRTMQIHLGRRTLHSANLYQIFTYVKNKQAELAEKECEVSGLLLYAKTDEDSLPEQEYRMCGNRIGIRTLDLNCDFPQIAAQLNWIVEGYLSPSGERGCEVRRGLVYEKTLDGTTVHN